MEQHKKWAPVKGYPEIYDVSSFGEVRSLDRVVQNRGRPKKIRGRLLKVKNNGTGYQFVTLCQAGKKKNKYVHRIVAEAFIPNPDNKPIVNHIDGEPQNNAYENLEWVHHRENVKHAYNTGLNSNKNSGHFMAVGVIDNELGAEFPTIKEWCEARGVQYSTGRNVLSGQRSRVIDIANVTRIKKSKK